MIAMNDTEGGRRGDAGRQGWENRGGGRGGRDGEAGKGREGEGGSEKGAYKGGEGEGGVKEEHTQDPGGH